jgi:hypothetical protein
MATPRSIEQFNEYCLDNKYSKWYFSIVEKTLVRNWTKKTAPTYVENHHILPKSIVKNDEVVCLTAREHFICHLLLPKMMKDMEIYYFMFNNEKIKIFNLRKFCRDNNLDQGAMTRVNNRKQITHKGYSKYE